MTLPRSNFKKWLPAIIMMLIIFGWSSLPGKTVDSIGLGVPSYQISGHTLLYFLLCFAYFKATHNLPVSIILSVLYSFTDEFHQKFVPLRSSSLFDIYTDAFGTLFAGLIIWKLQFILPKILKNWLNK